MSAEGVIDEGLQADCGPLSIDDKTKVGIPPGCLSILLVLTKEPYTATINIYDNLGKHVHSSIQKFGYCGELKNQGRVTETGMYQSYLIWNQREPDGELVGSAVYIWKVEMKYRSGRFEKFFKKQGIARSEEPLSTCAAGP
jgi:hypothetical protein